MHIRFVHRPLSRYVNALAAHGLLRRADGRAGAAARASSPSPPEYADAATVPRLLYLRARKFGG